MIEPLNTPKVSIIISNYNYANFLDICIESVLSQTYRNIEVIAVDDGSTDDSRDILSKRTKQVRLVFKDNGGQASSYNAGFAESTGSLIMFLDADDLLMPNAIELVVAFWQPDFSKVQFPLAVMDSQGRINTLTVPRGRLSRGNVRPEILSAGSYKTSPTSGNVYSRALLAAIMPIPEDRWRKASETYLNIHAGFKGEIGTVDSPLGFYRVHGASMSSVVQGGAVDIKQIRYLIEVHEQLQTLVEETAREHHLRPKTNLLMSNFAHLKLLLALAKMSGPSSVKRFVETARLAAKTILCARTANGTLANRTQMALWAVALTLTPRFIAVHLVKIAFDLSPRSKLIGSLRRV